MNLLWGVVAGVGFEPARGAGCACVGVGVCEEDYWVLALCTVYKFEKRESRDRCKAAIDAEVKRCDA